MFFGCATTPSQGKALVPEPTVATEDDEGNEFGRCKVCRANSFRGSTSDLCQVCLRCNVDYQYQNRSFPNVSDQPEPSPVAAQSTNPAQKKRPPDTSAQSLRFTGEICGFAPYKGLCYRETSSERFRCCHAILSCSRFLCYEVLGQAATVARHSSRPADYRLPQS